MRKALHIVGISKHAYYYQSKKRKHTVSCSQFTRKTTGEKVSNQEIVKIMKKFHSNANTKYGYIKMTYALKTKGFVVNKKKVYRLMKENLLLGKKNQSKEKSYAKYRKLMPESPLQMLQMDIKYVWVEQARKHAYILSVLDVFTRCVLHYTVAFSITQKEVKKAWEQVILNHLQPNDCLNRALNIEIRCDNDKRFCAKTVRDFFKENHLHQVFTHPYTPQENGHIESFHAILSNHLKPYTFWSMDELEENLAAFYPFYNEKRIHASIAYTSPSVFWQLWEKNLVIKHVDKVKRRIKFKLKIPHDQIHQHIKLTGQKNTLHSTNDKKVLCLQ
ncbi:MAG: IS3 family transposase [Bacteroidetes bacterium]|nr:MAG: IS3 family transposase [Bacteroidota bacterium]